MKKMCGQGRGIVEGSRARGAEAEAKGVGLGRGLEKKMVG